MRQSVSVRDRINGLFTEKWHMEVPSAEADLFETGILDSLHLVELFLHLEREFGMTIPLQEIEIEHFQSIARITDFVTNHRATAEQDDTVVARRSAERADERHVPSPF